MAKATIDDVAKLAGVSIKTVSRVVNHESNVRESTRATVKKAIAQLNYRPNLSARNLASHRARLVGLIYDDPTAYDVPSGGYVMRLQQGALRACRSAHFELFIHPCNYRDENLGRELAELVDEVRPSGIVIAAPLSNMPEIVAAIEATGTRLVRLSPGETRTQDFSIGTNDREVCAEMTRYLASLGHERIAFITGHPQHNAVANRFLGYKDGLQESGLEFSERLVARGDNSVGSGEACAKKLLQLESPPTAIFAANDDMAAGVMRLAARRRIDVPGQLSIAGCDDFAFAQQIYPELTTISQPLPAMAEQAALAIINDGKNLSARSGVEVIPGQLQIRRSTGPAPG